MDRGRRRRTMLPEETIPYLGERFSGPIGGLTHVARRFSVTRAGARPLPCALTVLWVRGALPRPGDPGSRRILTGTDSVSGFHGVVSARAGGSFWGDRGTA